MQKIWRSTNDSRMNLGRRDNLHLVYIDIDRCRYQTTKYVPLRVSFTFNPHRPQVPPSLTHKKKSIYQTWINLQILWVLSSEFHSCWVHILSNSSHVFVGSHTSGIHLLWVHTVLWMKILHFTVGEHSIDEPINLKFSAELGQQGQALLLAGQLQQVWSLTHDGCTPGWHFEDLFLLGFPGDHVEFFHLSLTKQTACKYNALAYIKYSVRSTIVITLYKKIGNPVATK